MLNLDYLCMKHGQEIGGVTDENNLRKALGVLQEDGVYAMFLWIQKKVDKDADKDKEKKSEKPRLAGKIIDLLNEDEIRKVFLREDRRFEKDFTAFTKQLTYEVAQDIDKLLFMKKVLERTLVYALYHAKKETNE